jgi:type IV pilus assembly protein PilC
VLTIASTAIIFSLITFVMPVFIGMFKSGGRVLPLPTRILLTMSGAINKYWFFMLLAICILIYAIRQYLKTEKGKRIIDMLFLRIPVVKGTVQKILTSRFTRTLSTLLASGVPLLDALDVTSKVIGNTKIQDGLRDTKDKLRKGIELSGLIKELGIFPPMVDSMVKVGEESGSMDVILEKTANFYEDEAEAALQKLTTLIEPILILIMALVLGFIIISIALPMFQVVNTVQ